MTCEWTEADEVLWGILRRKQAHMLLEAQGGGPDADQAEKVVDAYLVKRDGQYAQNDRHEDMADAINEVIGHG